MDFIYTLVKKKMTGFYIEVNPVLLASTIHCFEFEKAQHNKLSH